MNATEVLGYAPNQIAALSEEEFPALVDAAIRLDRSITKDTEQLNGFKDRLKAAARAELLKTIPEKDLPGAAKLYPGASGMSARVEFPKPALMRGSFYFIPGSPNAWTVRADENVSLGDLRKIAGPAFEKLFHACFRPAKAFKDLAAVLLTKTQAEKLIDAISEDSSPRVKFNTKL